MKSFYIILFSIIVHVRTSNSEIPKNIQDQLKALKNVPLDLVSKVGYSTPPAEAQIYCQNCNIISDAVLASIRAGANREDVKQLLLQVCAISNIQPSYVCTGLTDLFIDEIFFIVKSRPQLTASMVCNVVFQQYKCGGDELPNWSVDIDDSLVYLYQKNIFRKQLETLSGEDKNNNFIFLHLTDIHFEPKYQAGGNAACGAVSCCRSDQGSASSAANKAGKWGDYRDCDTPWDTIVNMLNQIRENHKRIDYIYVTGNIVDHGIWESSVDQNIQSINRSYRAIREVFGNVPVFPLIGTYDLSPVGQVSPLVSAPTPSLMTKPFYRALASAWNWLPPPVRGMVEEAGFYTMVVKPGLRVIALNNIECSVNNLWLLYENSFPKRQLQSLYNILLKAEQHSEFVHILAHIPSGDPTFYNICSREYRRIVDRFSHIITAQFNGFTHNDEFNVYYSLSNPSEAENLAWNGASGSSYGEVNANYRIYSMERRFYQVANHETWIYNLTQANLPGNTPYWYPEYSFKEAFHLQRIVPSDIDKFLNSLATNPILLRQYFEFYVKQGDPALRQGCNNNCLVNLLCDITKTSYGGSNQRCQQLSALFWETISRINDEL